MTLNEALAKVRDFILDDPFWGDSEIEGWLNDGYISFFANRGIEERWDLDVITVSRLAKKPNMYKIFDIWYEPTGSTSYTRLSNTTYRIFDNFIEFGSTLTGKIYIEGEKMPSRISEGVEFLLPEQYQMGIVQYAVAIAFLKDEDEKSSASFYSLYLSAKRDWEKMPTLRTTKWRDNWYGNE